MAIDHSRWIGAIERIVVGVGVGVMGLEVAGGAADRIGREEAAEARGVVVGEGVVQAGFGIVFISGETVVGRAGGGLQARHLGGGKEQAVEKLSTALDISWPQMATNGLDEETKGQLIQ